MLLFVFDIDGTLTDSIDLHVKCFLEAFSAVGVTDIDTDWGSYTHHTDSWIFAEVFRRNAGRDPNAAEKELFATHLSHQFDVCTTEKAFNEIQGARKFIERLQTMGNVAFAFATGSYRLPAIRKLKQIGIEVPPELLVTASEYETREEIVWQAVLAARSHYKVDDFSRVVSVGDGYWDLMTARNLKINFIGISSGQAAEKLKVAGATAIFTDLMEIGAMDSKHWPSGLFV